MLKAFFQAVVTRAGRDEATLIEPMHLKNLLHDKGLPRRNRVLLTLAASDSPLTVAELKALAKGAGLREIERWNVSDILAKTDGAAIFIGGKWELSPKGKEEVRVLAGEFAEVPVQRKVSRELRALLRGLKHVDTVAFVEEAITCYEVGAHRAAVVLSWAGALSLLQQHVIDNHLQAFNLEAARRERHWKPAKTKDDLSRMLDSRFLDLIEFLSIIGQNVKHELQELCLKLRNGCGHPNSLKLDVHRVAAHIEILVLNVFVPFG